MVSASTSLSTILSCVLLSGVILGNPVGQRWLEQDAQRKPQDFREPQLHRPQSYMRVRNLASSGVFDIRDIRGISRGQWYKTARRLESLQDLLIRLQEKYLPKNRTSSMIRVPLAEHLSALSAGRQPAGNSIRRLRKTLKKLKKQMLTATNGTVRDASIVRSILKSLAPRRKLTKPTQSSGADQHNLSSILLAVEDDRDKETTDDIHHPLDANVQSSQSPKPKLCIRKMPSGRTVSKHSKKQVSRNIKKRGTMETKISEGSFGGFGSFDVKPKTGFSGFGQFASEFGQPGKTIPAGNVPPLPKYNSQQDTGFGSYGKSDSDSSEISDSSTGFGSFSSKVEDHHYQDTGFGDFGKFTPDSSKSTHSDSAFKGFESFQSVEGKDSGNIDEFLSQPIVDSASSEYFDGQNSEFVDVGSWGAPIHRQNSDMEKIMTTPDWLHPSNWHAGPLPVEELGGKMIGTPDSFVPPPLPNSDSNINNENSELPQMSAMGDEDDYEIYAC